MSNSDSKQFNIEEHQYLTFLLKNEMFGIDVLHIKEIIEYAMVTRVPTMQNFIKGVTNVRGNVVPVIDLCGRLNQGESDIDKKTCIIIVEINVNNENIEIGLIVDSVNQVYDIMPESIEESPSFGAKIRKDFIKQMGKVDDKFIVILNLENILNIDELSIINKKQHL
jgi:purine-binding chemotaxis protein CheW